MVKLCIRQLDQLGTHNCSFVMRIIFLGYVATNGRKMYFPSLLKSSRRLCHICMKEFSINTQQTSTLIPYCSRQKQLSVQNMIIEFCKLMSSKKLIETGSDYFLLMWCRNHVSSPSPISMKALEMKGIINWSKYVEILIPETLDNQKIIVFGKASYFFSPFFQPLPEPY